MHLVGKQLENFFNKYVTSTDLISFILNILCPFLQPVVTPSTYLGAGVQYAESLLLTADFLGGVSMLGDLFNALMNLNTGLPRVGQDNDELILGVITVVGNFVFPLVLSIIGG
eukprot:CAMPEP_0170487492 /NCGR_PEP_ID=MMETSP0208-20121228/6295_1 /TAXON_ID=197538 /ORGANISM="Strombidium inclinatum, Strain S3" /LENGTH=112 /DNA_ID=CAMNT_0010761789 /DNA_START=786 /DNA_END=1120 /DNA_ORIENTATION=+